MSIAKQRAAIDLGVSTVGAAMQGDWVGVSIGLTAMAIPTVGSGEIKILKGIGEEVVEATAKQGAEQGGKLVYRGGSDSADNLTPRPGKDTDAGDPKRGLSTFDSLEKALRPGEKAQVIDTSKLTSCGAHCTPDGHVSLRPGTQEELEAWAKTRGTGDVHPLTKEVKEAVVGTVKRPQ